MIEEKYLPLGTVVLLKNAKKRLMIVGYEAITNEEQQKTYDYIACLYPEGVVAPDKNLLFNHDQIENIIFRGFTDYEDDLFKRNLKEIVNKRKSLQSTNSNVSATNNNEIMEILDSNE